MIDPRTVMIAIPAYDGKVMAELTGVLASCRNLYAALSIPTECSHVSLVRNIIASQFMASNFEWLVCIDSDTVPSRWDLELLLQPCDTEATYFEDTGGERLSARRVGSPRPTRLGIAQSAGTGTLELLDSKTIAAADVLVVAEYSAKSEDLQPVKFGMGFVRIHRSVFRTLEALVHDGGPTIEVQRHDFERLDKLLSGPDPDPAEVRLAANTLLLNKEDKAGQPRLWQTAHKGRMLYDYFPSGPILSQFVPTAEWKGEDHGFFTLCMIAGIVPRVETRTRLIHIGRKGYPYLGPDTGEGQ